MAAPFAPYEWMIAWRYLRARRAEGGVSVMTVISLVGVTLAVFALIATLAVRSGFRDEFVDTITGANAHVTLYAPSADGRGTGPVEDAAAVAARVAAVPGVTRAAPLVRGQALATFQGRNAFVDVYGIAPADLAAIPRIAHPEDSQGSLADFPNGIALGSVLARDLGVGVGDRVRLVVPDGARTPLGVQPRVSSFDVTYIFTAGRYDIDQVRAYLPISEAGPFFNAPEGGASEVEAMVADPEGVASLVPAIAAAAGPHLFAWTWMDGSGAFLDALTVEDNVMFVILSVLVLIASMNIISGLIMLVKNKGRDIGILRTVGLTEGSILRVFFICGASIGTLGTILGVLLGCAFAIWIDPIFAAVNYVAGGGVWDPSIRGLYRLPARLEWHDVLSAVSLSLFLSWVITIFPARRAARMNPVEALRYE